MSIDWKQKLSSVKVGDIIHADAPTGASLICLVMYITERLIHTKTVTSQLKLSFDRSTGVALWGSNRARCVIDSLAKLPDDIHRIMLDLDRKYSEDTSALKTEAEFARFRLSEAERRALLFIGPFYESHPIE